MSVAGVGILEFCFWCYVLCVSSWQPLQHRQEGLRREHSRRPDLHWTNPIFRSRWHCKWNLTTAKTKMSWKKKKQKKIPNLGNFLLDKNWYIVDKSRRSILYKLSYKFCLLHTRLGIQKMYMYCCYPLDIVHWTKSYNHTSYINDAPHHSYNSVLGKTGLVLYKSSKNLWQQKGMRITIHSFMQAFRSTIGDLHSKFPKSKALTSYGTDIRKRRLHKLSFCCIMVLYVVFQPKVVGDKTRKWSKLAVRRVFCDIADIDTDCLHCVQKCA